MTVAIENKPASVQTIQASINERNLLNNVRHMFTSSWTMFAELMQNARRAHATKVEFRMDKNATCVVSDNGDGVKDFQKFIAVAESGWDNQTMIEESPFGMGFLSCLMACERVEIYSGRQMVSVSLKEVQDKKAIVVHTVDKTVFGTEIHLVGMDKKLCETHKDYGSDKSIPVLRHKLELFCRGFPIDVLFNGQSLARPNALEALKGEKTDIGVVSIRGIDFDVHPKFETNLPYDLSNIRLYLQGLPISEQSYGSHVAIVHLESTRFTARVPDRTELFDYPEAIEKITASVKERIRNHLVQMKTSLSGQEFVRLYWKHCWRLGVQHLLADIPMVPTRIFNQVNDVTMRFEDTFYPYQLDTSQFITLEQVQSGEIKVIKSLHTSVDNDDPFSIEVMNFLFASGYPCTQKSFEGHWLQKYLVDTDDLVFDVNPVNLADESHQLWVENKDVTLRLCERVEINITHRLDPKFLFNKVSNDSWYALNPVDYMTPAEQGQIKDYERGNAITVYVPTNAGIGRFVDITSSFATEHEDFCEEDRDRANDDLVNELGAIRGESLYKLMNGSLDFYKVNVREKQCNELVVCHVKKSGNHDNYTLCMTEFDDKLLTKVAAALNSAKGTKSKSSKLTAEQIKAAILASLE